MGEQAAILREMLAVTHKIHAKVKELGSRSAEEGLPVLAEIEELLVSREDLINRLKTLKPSNLLVAPADHDQLLAEVRDLNGEISKELSAKREELAASLRKVREGKKALASVREFSARKGKLLDYRK